jgi:deazaflavin-dependent oxidoreductase (nitroreductase family)
MSPTRLERAGSPKGWKRLLFRAPIAVYRARLGFLLGSRFVMIEHTGRKTGATRRTVLEVVVNDPDAVYVTAAWGSRAQWLRNVRANPEVVSHLGSHRYQTTAEMVTKDDAATLMNRYADSHPEALRKLSAFMLDDPGETPAEQAAHVAASIPMVRLPKPG